MTKRQAALLASKAAAAVNLKHGEASERTAEYRAWANLLSRCFNPNMTRYERYGGRGVKVCSRWMDYANFLADMGRKPTPDHSIDRIDTNADYGPKNCRWATRSEQQRNKARNELLTINGVTKQIDDWADEYGISRAMIRGRIRLGWSGSKILTEPARRQPVLLTAFGKTQNVSDWAREYGIKIVTLHWRLSHGYTLEQALSK